MPDVSFGKYRLKKRIAFGGMAEIFLAELEGSDGFSKTVVIKRILAHLSEERDFINMFIDEAKLAATLTHPNIVQVHELGQVDGSYFIAMEYVQGSDLARIFKRLRQAGEQFPPAVAIAIGVDVARGLHAAHEKKNAAGESVDLVHRDVSPHNVLISLDGAVKIGDFGIAKAAGKSTKTKSGILKGKFAYMAPEHASLLPIDRRADLFALAIVLYELFTGKRLYRGDSDLHVLELARAANVPPLDEAVPGFPPRLARVMQRAMAASPADRFESCAAFGAALQEEATAFGKAATVDDVAALVRRVSAPEYDFDEAPKAVTASDPMPSVDVDLPSGVATRPATPSPPMPSSPSPSPSPSPWPTPPESPRPGTKPTTAAVAKKPLRRALVGTFVVTGVLAMVATIGSFLRPAAEITSSAPAPSLLSNAPSPQTPTPTSLPSSPATIPSSTPATPVVAAPAAIEVGYLSINTKPWAYAYLDGKKLPRATPIDRFAVPAGAHTLELDCPAAKKRQRLEVTIEPGKTLKKFFSFEAKAPPL